MGNNVGTPRKIVIDGITFDIFPDTNVTFNIGNYEIEGQATTGDTLYKRTKKVQTKEGITLAVNPQKLAQLEEKANSLADKTFAVEYADGTTYRATGQINLENWESESGKASITMIPKRNWTKFDA